MKKANHFLYSTILLFTLSLFFGCSEDELPVNEPIQESTAKQLNLTTSSALTLQSKKDVFNYFLEKVKSGEDVTDELANYLTDNHKNLGFGADVEANRNFIRSVINPDDFICDDTNIPIQDYIDSIRPTLTFEQFLAFIFAGDYPTIDAIYFKDPNERQVYGINGEFTNDINRTFKDLKRFWDIPSDDINVLSMKGTFFTDFDRVLQVEQFVYPGQSLEDDIFWVTLYQEVFGSDTFWNYNHPFLTFNAFAVSAPGTYIMDRIIMGDGILTAYDEIGLGDVAPAAILAHEYAHQVQFENDYFTPIGDPVEQPAATRRTELMADAMSAYYLTHKRGGTYNQKRVEQFLQVFYNIGDCSFDSDGHHGTFEQRFAAAQFGFELADDTQKKGMILSADEFLALFEAELDNIINCDACVNK